MKLLMKWSAAQRNTLILGGCGLLIVVLHAVVFRVIRQGYARASVYRTTAANGQQLLAESELQFFLAAETNRLNDVDAEVVPMVMQINALLDSLYCCLQPVWYLESLSIFGFTETIRTWKGHFA
jgi:hypothetical protein